MLSCTHSIGKTGVATRGLDGAACRAEARLPHHGPRLALKRVDERHTVTVVANGFIWRETSYASLSTIARAITGTNWNGACCFGVRIDKETTVSPDTADTPRVLANGRTPTQTASSKSQWAVTIGLPSGHAAPVGPSLGEGEY